MNNNEVGVYVHIPFCKHKCDYCDFISYCNKDDLIEKYIKALIKEIKSQNIKPWITTIYIGGGTPSYIDSKYIKQILQEIKKKNITKNTEITIEVNPGTVTKEKVEEYKECGINRLSIGLQVTQDKILKDIGRIHNYANGKLIQRKQWKLHLYRFREPSYFDRYRNLEEESGGRSEGAGNDTDGYFRDFYYT